MGDGTVHREFFSLAGRGGPHGCSPPRPTSSPTPSHMVPPDAADAALPSADELRAEEEARHMRREAEIERSWSKEVVVEGGGRQAWPGARATLHVVSTVVSSRSGEGVGSVFEDSRPLGVPRLLLLGRGILVPGLERAVGGMREGESARVVVQPEGAYGDAGSPAAPRVPGSAVVTCASLRRRRRPLPLQHLTPAACPLP